METSLEFDFGLEKSRRNSETGNWKVRFLFLPLLRTGGFSEIHGIDHPLICTPPSSRNRGEDAVEDKFACVCSIAVFVRGMSMGPVSES